jgi:hypothetical protein
VNRTLPCSLLIVSLFGAGAECTGVATTDPPAPDQVEHVLSRIGYGPDAWSRGRIEWLGVHDYVEEQLHPETIDDSAFQARIAGLTAPRLSWPELQDSYCFGRGDVRCPLGSRTIARDELAYAKILRSIYSRRQLEAVLVDFWFDHFNVNATEGRLRISAIPLERDAIRPHVLGRFEDLLVATARSPAMLEYLDNGRNYKDGYFTARGILGMNENYARELMELHTLGVDGGYDQVDVIEVSRALTGWLLVPRFKTYYSPGGRVDDERNLWAWSENRFFEFDVRAHDSGPKEVMGSLHLGAGGGVEDGLAVLSFLANHPKTAERISRLLVQRFVSETPPEQLVAEAAGTFLATGGDLREVMRTILHSPDFTRDHYREKVKRPLVLMASIARATAAELGVGQPELLMVEQALVAMGEPLYRATPPTGFPDDTRHWASPGTLLTRLNRIHGMVSYWNLGIDYGIAGGSSAEVADALVSKFLPGGISEASRREIVAFLDGIGASDSFRIKQAAAMVFSAPEFQKH